MTAMIKRLFSRRKDYAGRTINSVIASLASQSGTDVRAWSYLKEQAIYENSETGMRIYPYEVSKYTSQCEINR